VEFVSQNNQICRRSSTEYQIPSKSPKYTQFFLQYPIEDSIQISHQVSVQISFKEPHKVSIQIADSILCTYLNGTAGVRCQGGYACTNFKDEQIINVTNVGCGSCNGDYACHSDKYKNITVGEGSCVGKYSCSQGEYMKKYL
jgi:uncharacterized protein YcfJ